MGPSTAAISLLSWVTSGFVHVFACLLLLQFF
jgi:hypothetical protein